MTSKNQGFTLVALEEPLHDLPLLKPAGHLNFPPLKSALTAIHHAHGHPKQILHSPFALQEIIGHQFWFSGKPGLPMSGAPILNDRLEVIGLCQGSAQMNGEESSCSPCLHHQALRMDRIQHELKSSIHQLTRRDQAFLRDEHAITGFLLSTEG